MAPPPNQPVTSERFARVVLAAFAGVSLPALGQALFMPDMPATALLRAKLAILWGGGCVAALLFVVIAAVVLPLLRRRITLASGFWIGFGLAIGPFIVQFFDGRNQGAVVGLVAAVLGTAVQLPAPGRTLATAWGALVAIAVPVLWFVPLSFGLGPQPPSLAAPATDSRPHGPDVLLISVDTLRADALSDERITLPNFERLRAMSVSSDYGLAPSPSTFPSHLTMLSGLGVLRHGAITNEHRVPDEVPMVQESFLAAGYRTAAVVSNGTLRGWAGWARGFEAYDDSGITWSGDLIVLRSRVDRTTWLGWLVPSTYTPELELAVNRLTMRSVGGLAQVEGDRTLRSFDQYHEELLESNTPYFFFLHFMDPHDPYNPPDHLAGTVADRAAAPPLAKEIGLAGRDLPVETERRLAAGDPDAPAVAEFLHGVYLEEVLFVDECIGHALDRVEASGRQTVILLTSDHGEHFGEHGLMLHSNSLYEELLRVPFMLAAPGLGAGEALAVRPHLEDVTPTLLALAGLPVPGGLDGRDLSATDLAERDHHAVLNLEIAVRDRNWKLLADYRRQTAGHVELVPQQLFDVDSDAAEQNDVLRENTPRVALLAQSGEAQLQGATFIEIPELTELDREILSELGYVDEDD